MMLAISKEINLLKSVSTVKSLVVLLSIILAIVFVGCSEPKNLEEIQIEGIDHDAPSSISLIDYQFTYGETNSHSAFTDLTRYRNIFYMVFRTSDSHAFGKNGESVLMASQDFINWKEISRFSHPEFDLRDPKFTTTKSALQLVIHGSKFVDSVLVEIQDFRSHYDVTSNTWSDLANFKVGNLESTNETWPWRITYNNDTAFSIGHIYDLTGQQDLLDLYYSMDQGDTFNRSFLTIPGLEHRSGEGTIRVLDDKYYCLIRQNKGQPALLGVSVNPTNFWEWTYIDKPSLGGPNFLVCNDSLYVIAGRDNSVRGTRTTFVALYNSKAQNLFSEIDLPSGGDTGYPGLVISNDTLYMSYYSSHEEFSGIYTARIKIDSAD